MSFQPNPNDELTIAGETYRVAEHPAAPGRGIAHGQEGRAGIVYRLVALTPPPQAKPPGEGVRSAALKVFKPRFRLPFLVSQAEQLAAHADLPGLAAGRRTVLTPSRHADLLRQHPDLTYAVLMPWIEGPNWQEFLLDGRPLPAEQSPLLARSLAQVLLGMEEQGLAHCDLSGSNVMLPLLAGGKGVELIDLEGCYAPGMSQPQALSSGSAGYAHQQAAGGLWGPEADRFAGAVLLAEMLGWCDPAVVAQAWGESYFEPGEMQRECPRAQLLEESLRRHWGDGVAHLFRRAWRSDTLADCPTFGEWLVALPERAPATVGQVDNLPYTLEEEPKVRAEPAPLVAEIRAFLQAARRMEERGNLDGALETYRQALELAQGDPALGSMAREIALTLQEVESKRRAVPPPPAPAPVGQVANLPYAAPTEAAGPGVRAEPRPRRRGRGWVWVAGLAGLLALAGLGLFLLPALRPAAMPPTPVLAGTPYPRPAVAIAPENAERVVQLARWSKGMVGEVAWSPDGRLLAVASSLGINLYDAGTLEEVRYLESDAWVSSVAFSPDGATLAAGSLDNTVRLWRVSDGALLRTLEGHTDWVRSVAFSPDGATLASGSDDNTVRLWRVADGALLRTLEGHTDRVRSVAFSPDGATLASGSADNTVRLWRVSDGALLRTLEGHAGWVWSVAFSPDGATLASGSEDNTVRLWQAADGALLQTLQGHTDGVWSVVFSPDGTTLASGSGDGTVRLWRVADGAPLRTLEGHAVGVVSVAFSPDGATLASRSWDGTVRLWGGQ